MAAEHREPSLRPHGDHRNSTDSRSSSGRRRSSSFSCRQVDARSENSSMEQTPNASHEGRVDELQIHQAKPGQERLLAQKARDQLKGDRGSGPADTKPSRGFQSSDTFRTDSPHNKLGGKVVNLVLPRRMSPADFSFRLNLGGARLPADFTSTSTARQISDREMNERAIRDDGKDDEDEPFPTALMTKAGIPMKLSRQQICFGLEDCKIFDGSLIDLHM